MSNVKELFSVLIDAAENPLGYVDWWKKSNDRKVVGILPMNFPPELVHAAGALPVLIQEDRNQITFGRTLLHEFYCGFTRSLVDQAATKRLESFDGFFVVDHCVALLGAVDALRFQLPEKKVYLAQYPASMDEDSTSIQVGRKNAAIVTELEDFCGVHISDEVLTASIRKYNRSRQLIRKLYDLRRSGRASVSAVQMQVLIKSSMVMDIDQHTEILLELLPLIEVEGTKNPELVKVHLSGHLCHAPRSELLELIEQSGAVIVDDDLFAGYRYISTDVAEEGPPMEALVSWYKSRNVNAPCCTRAQKNVDWADFLVEKVNSNGAQGVITLMPKFCEPHMLYYPEIKKALEKNKIPHIRIETEHEGIPIESIKTRLESFFEMVKRAKVA